MNIDGSVYCECAITVKNYLSALVVAIVSVILGSFIFDYSFFYAILGIIFLIFLFYIEVNYANDFSDIHSPYLHELLNSEDEKLTLTIKNILNSNGRVTIADLDKIKRTIQEICSLMDGDIVEMHSSRDLIESVIVRCLKSHPDEEVSKSI